MPKISVIVAVYAVEKYLTRCLDSLRCQTLEDFEVLLIDDGSKDDSGKICDRYVKEDSRFRVVHKENGGVASARQCGLSLASGEYVIHADPDDWVDSQMLEDLYGYACKTNADMVICDFFYHDVHGGSYVSQKIDELKTSDILKGLFDEVDGYCWNKLIKRSCIEQFGVRFSENMVVWEDMLFCIDFLKNPVSVAYLSNAYYHYVRDENCNSLVDAVSRKKLNSMIYFIDHCTNSIPNFDLALLDRKKIEVKRTAFLLKDVSKKEFRSFYPEIESLFIIRFDGFRKLDVLIQFAMTKSWIIAKFALLIWKIYFNFRRKL